MMSASIRTLLSSRWTVRSLVPNASGLYTPLSLLTHQTTIVRSLARTPGPKKDVPKEKPEKEPKPLVRQLRVPKKPKKASMARAGMRERQMEIIMKALDAPFSKEGPITEEERERRHKVGRDYVIGMFQQHNAMNHDLSCKLRLKQHAIHMLPRNTTMKAEALKVDCEGPPLWRRIPNDTPPIPNFDPSKFIKTPFG